jgi:type I restriction enzyme S subunit
VAFGDVVQLSKQRSNDPMSDGFDRYVGLDHLDPGDLKVRRWGNTADGTTFTSVFRPGQVLFGKRRAYQRKVAVADFEGVCSGDIYVLEPKNSALLPDLLPFICATNAFFEHAVGTSAGSLSPRTNWRSLATFEFDLPALDEQGRMLVLLQAALDVVVSLSQLVDRHRNLWAASIDELVVGGIGKRSHPRDVEALSLPVGWKLVKAEDLCDAPVMSGTTPRDGEKDPDSLCPFIKVGDLSFDGTLQFGPYGSHVSTRAFESTRTAHVRPGDVLTNIVGPPLGKVSIVPVWMGEALINQAIVRFRPSHPRLTPWLATYLMSSWAKSWLGSRSKKTSGQRNINARTCAALPVPIPPESDHEGLNQQIAFLQSAREALRERLGAAREFQKVLESRVWSQ